MAVLYRIANWAGIYENNRTRELKHMDWVPIPNKMDGDGYTELVSHPDGAAHLGAWLAIVEVASKCDPRGTLLREGGKPHDSSSLARMSRLPQHVFESVIPRAIHIGWLTSEVVASSMDTAIPHKGAGMPQEGAAKSQASDYGTERNGTEEKPPNPLAGEPSPETAKGPHGADADPPGFEVFWQEWPVHRRKANRAGCCRRWKRGELEADAEQVLAGLRRWKVSPDWQKDGGAYIPAPLVWLNQERWKVPAEAFAEQAFATATEGNGFVRAEKSVEEIDAMILEAHASHNRQ